MQAIVFDRNKIAFVVRGTIGIDHEPDLLAQHADVILADGTPIGFFGEGQGSGGSFGMDEVVYDPPLFQTHRPSSEAFINAGITKNVIPGLDTPDNLYKQIIALRKDVASYSGHIGFIKKASGDGFDLVID